MKPITSTNLQFGSLLNSNNFQASGTVGDWQEWDVKFGTPFPSDKVCVILTENYPAVTPSQTNPAVVGIIYNVNKDGFVLKARNSSSLIGKASFNWLAVHEKIDPPKIPYQICSGVTKSKVFSSTGRKGDWQNWDVIFDPPFYGPPMILLTESNLNIPSKNPAVIGIAKDTTQYGFNLAAHNTNNVSGEGTFYYMAIQPRRMDFGPTGAWIDYGKANKKMFRPHGLKGDWQEWDIPFNKSFSTPPIVFLTPNHNKGMIGDNPAPVGIARDVNTQGFRLSARNSAPVSGEGGFNWIAFGCRFSNS